MVGSHSMWRVSAAWDCPAGGLISPLSPNSSAECFLSPALLTRFVSLAMMIDMFVAIWKIHWKNGMFGKGGYELTLTLATLAFALIFLGAGPIAIDAIRGGGGRSRAKPGKT